MHYTQHGPITVSVEWIFSAQSFNIYVSLIFANISPVSVEKNFLFAISIYLISNVFLEKKKLPSTEFGWTMKCLQTRHSARRSGQETSCRIGECWPWSLIIVEDNHCWRLWWWSSSLLRRTLSGRQLRAAAADRATQLLAASCRPDECSCMRKFFIGMMMMNKMMSVVMMLKLKVTI